MKITTIDLGSNSLRVLQYDCINHKTIAEYEKTVGTADGLVETGKISDEAIMRITNALLESIQKIGYDPTQSIAVTTQAMRVATNNQEIIAKIEKQTGIKFQIIDGQKEASLTLLAIEYALKRENLPSENFLLLDIGGGSTELIVVSGENKIAKSFPFGIVTLTQSKDQTQMFREFQNEIAIFLQEISIDISSHAFVSTAGTPTTLCAVHLGMNYQTYDKHKVNGTKLYMNNVLDVQKEFQSLSEDELMIKVGTGRTAYINTGVEIFKLFYHLLKKDHSIVFDDGLREGVAINFCLQKQFS